MNDPEFWKRKLMAFLHDPPDKALDIPGHRERARSFMKQAGFTDDKISAYYKEADQTAAAADRFPFPEWNRSDLHSPFGDGDHPFRHPLGGSDLSVDPAFSSEALVEDVFQTVQKGVVVDDIPEEKRPRANFFLHWRRWPIESAKQDPRTAYLPAETRLPDHTIWCHNSVVSALEGCYAKGHKPAFLFLQLGPVQEFIAQARSTRDLWSGSYLLSWLMAHAHKAIAEWIGPDTIIFPNLLGQPLFDLMMSDLYKQVRFAAGDGKEETLWQRLKLHPKEYLTPTLPNRLLALVPSKEGEAIARAAETAIREELKNIAGACWGWINKHHPLNKDWRTRFDEQIERFPQIQWMVEPWNARSVEEDVKAFLALYDPPSEGAQNLKAVLDLANGFPKEHRTGYHLDNPAFCWPYYYARAARDFDGRRQLRDFDFWKTDDHQAGAVKDSLSGKEEVIGDENWWKAIHQKKVPAKMAFLFRSSDVFGAINLVKKVWHKAWLKEENDLKVEQALSFESVPGVAAGRWRAEVLKTSPETCEQIMKVIEKVQTVAEKIGLDITKTDARDADRWLQLNDPECFFESTWEKEDVQQEIPNEARQILDLLRAKRDGKRIIPPPPKYYAVIALDGDEMGKWVAGEKTPPLAKQFSSEAHKYFTKQENWKEKYEWDADKLRRPLSPSYHLQFSEALSNFSTYLARPVVEHFGGQLIYAGGDDVLAMVPASEAFRCARALRAAFKGEKELEGLVPGVFEVKGTNGGFVKLADPKPEQPTWPLIVPGPEAEVSAGIAIGHIHSPLQNLVRAAHAAEKRAKNKYHRAAFAVSLYKRSGEIVEWGGKWKSGALEAYDALGELLNDPKVSAKLPYAMVGWFTPYGIKKPGEQAALKDVAEFDFNEVLHKEMAHVLKQQADGAKPELKSRFEDKMDAYLEKLCTDGKRPLPDFANLFAVAAFMRRGE